MAVALEIPQLPERDRMPQMQVRRSGIHAQLDPQRPALGELGGQLGR